MLIKELILLCSIYENIYIFAEIKNKKTMYQVHIFRGMDRECISCDSLQNANSTIIDIASHNGWNYKYDQDGFAYAHAGDNHYININAFIFQII